MNPLTDPRWDAFVAGHTASSAFHQRGWLEALARTYGYEPLVLTSSRSDEPLNDGIVFCHVSSWITGQRLVSLPFADHCEPLLKDPSQLPEFIDWLQSEQKQRGLKFIEIRPFSGVLEDAGEMELSRSYCFHELDLSPSLEDIYRRMHRDSMQRRIRRAEREGLTYESGRSTVLVEEFYRLLLITRRRHRLLPQPRAWFNNLVECMGDRIQIRVARKGDRAIAAILSLAHRLSTIYKYGCSDERFHSLGAMPFLFWKLIEESKASGVEKIDLGRSDLDQESLIAFKDKLGATKMLLNYYQYPQPVERKAVTEQWQSIRSLFSILPDFASSTAGKLVYRHIG